MEEALVKKVNKQIRSEKSHEHPSFTQRCSDHVSNFGGSWKFIGLFSAFFLAWILFNLYVWDFDQYPFILLNLILSCLAVFQAPFILMSQNRLTEIDRKRDEKVYKLSMISELEIQALHDKLDKLIKDHKRK